MATNVIHVEEEFEIRQRFTKLDRMDLRRLMNLRADIQINCINTEFAYDDLNLIEHVIEEKIRDR